MQFAPKICIAFVMHIYYNCDTENKGGFEMENYKEMYRELFIAVTKAVRILEEAQQKCEEMYIEAEDRDKVINIVKRLKDN